MVVVDIVVVGGGGDRCRLCAPKLEAASTVPETGLKPELELLLTAPLGVALALVLADS